MNHELSVVFQEIGDTEFAAIRTFVYQRFGIALTEQKRTLVSGRLQSVLRKHNFHSYAEYLHYLQDDSSGAAASELVNVITTNHTFFFREKEHLDFIVSDALPSLLAQLSETRSTDLRLWSAGCSTGEEPFSVTITLMEALGTRYSQYQAGILATDISARVLDLAKQGIYDKEKLQNMSPDLIHKYFNQLSEDSFQVKPFLQKEVTFRRFNLMNDVYPFQSMFHIILCRNVMIYFDDAHRKHIVDRFEQLLVPGGYLLIGHSESIGRLSGSLQYIRPAVYQRQKGPTHA